MIDVSVHYISPISRCASCVHSSLNSGVQTANTETLDIAISIYHVRY